MRTAHKVAMSRKAKSHKHLEPGRPGAGGATARPRPSRASGCAAPRWHGASVDWRRRCARWLAALAFCSLTTTALPASAAESAGEMAAGLFKLVAAIVLVVAMGFALGAFGHTVNNLFRRRSELTFEVMRRSPKMSLLTGAVVTLVSLGLLAILHAAPPLQLVVLLAYLGSLGMFALGATARLAAKHVDRQLIGDELPDARAHIKGSVLLVAINGVPLLGTILFVGIVLAAVGGALLSYFAGRRPAQQPPAAAPPAATPPAATPPAEQGH